MKLCYLKFWICLSLSLFVIACAQAKRVRPEQTKTEILPIVGSDVLQTGSCNRGLFSININTQDGVMNIQSQGFVTAKLVKNPWAVLSYLNKKGPEAKINGVEFLNIGDPIMFLNEARPTSTRLDKAQIQSLRQASNLSNQMALRFEKKGNLYVASLMGEPITQSSVQKVEKTQTLDSEGNTEEEEKEKTTESESSKPAITSPISMSQGGIGTFRSLLLNETELGSSALTIPSPVTKTEEGFLSYSVEVGKKLDLTLQPETQAPSDSSFQVLTILLSSPAKGFFYVKKETPGNTALSMEAKTAKGEIPEGTYDLRVARHFITQIPIGKEDNEGSVCMDLSVGSSGKLEIKKPEQK